MFRLFLAVAISFAVATCAYSMGGSGAPATDSIPRPKNNILADLTDIQGITTRVEFFTCERKTFLPLKRGEGLLMVGFDKVKKVDFGHLETDSTLKAVFTMTDGQEIEGSLDANAVCTGATKFGSYQIELKGIKEVSVRGK